MGIGDGWCLPDTRTSCSIIAIEHTTVFKKEYDSVLQQYEDNPEKRNYLETEEFGRLAEIFPYRCYASNSSWSHSFNVFPTQKMNIGCCSRIRLGPHSSA
jgi:hypothetical protein